MRDDHTTYTVPASQLQLNTRLLPTLVVLLLLLQLTLPYRGWVVLLAGLGGGWLIGYLWARSLARELRLKREMRFGWAQVGDRLQERFTLVNPGWAAALWVEVIDHSTLPDYQASRATGVGGCSSSRWQTEGVCTCRGLFTLGPTSLRTGDPFGLYTVSLHDADETALMVTPPILPLPTIEIAPGGRAGQGRRPRADPFERTVGAASVRDYRPGDSLRWIHWRVSAHRDDLFVRIFEATPTSDWWVFLDLEQRVQVGQGWGSSEEHGVTLAASLADRGLRAGRAVGLVAYGEELAWLPPQRGDKQRLEILRALALATPGSRPLADLLRERGAQPTSEQRASLVIITPAAVGEWMGALLSLLQRGAVPTVLLLDPPSFGGGGDDPTELAATTSKTLALLSDLGVARYLITPDVLDRPEARPGQRGQWEWRILPTGRAVPVRRPDDMAWRGLA